MFQVHSNVKTLLTIGSYVSSALKCKMVLLTNYLCMYRQGHRAGLGARVRRSAADLPSGSGHVTKDWAGRPGRREAVVVRCLSVTHMCAILILNHYRLN